jgi:hypothetical protein
MQYKEEIMSEEFTKHLFKFPCRFGEFHMVVHHFTGPDTGGPHCHPYGFMTHILKGGYIERRYTLHETFWGCEDIFRQPGESFYVPATTIHELVALPGGECWTVITPGPKEREPGFWTFNEHGAWFRQWNESEVVQKLILYPPDEMV